jgi:DNA repair protein RadD
MFSLYPYQHECVRRVQWAIRKGYKRIVIVAPTGSGKTVLGAHIMISALAKQRRSLFFAHRRELIKQSFCKLARSGCPVDQLSIIMADRMLGNPPVDVDVDACDDARLWLHGARARPSAPIQIASIDTFRNRRAPPSDIIIIDECHRALSPSYLRMLDIYRDAVHIGLTATPWRADGRGLEEYYQHLVVAALPSQLIAEGYILEPRVFVPPREDLPDLSGVRIVNGDYDEHQLSVAVDDDRLIGNIVEHWFREARGIRTVLFPASIAHSKHLCERFAAAGARFEHLDGSTPARERDAILARVDRHEIDGVSSCDALSEGWDQPSVACAVLAKPTRSLTKYIQKAGRVLRPCVGKGEPIILDHAGCAYDNHCLPHQDQEYSLKPRPKKPREQVPGTIWCKQCWALLPSGTKICPRCLFVFPDAPATPKPDKTKEAEATLVEVRAASMTEKRAVWESLCKRAAAEAYHPGWIGIQYRNRFHERPPAGFTVPKYERPEASDAEMTVALARLKAIAELRRYKPGWVAKRFYEKFGQRAPEERQTRMDIESRES